MPEFSLALALRGMDIQGGLASQSISSEEDNAALASRISKAAPDQDTGQSGSVSPLRGRV